MIRKEPMIGSLEADGEAPEETGVCARAWRRGDVREKTARSQEQKEVFIVTSIPNKVTAREDGP